MPLDNPSRRHPQHDRRYNSGPGYSGDGRGYVPHGPRRPFQSGRGSYNEPGHLPSRGAKIMPRDQLLVANTSIKVEDNDGQSSLTPAPVSASSTSPDKSSFTGKRSRTDSVAAEAEPSSRRPSPFTSSAAITVAAPVDSAPVPAPAPAPVPALVQPTPIEPQPQTSATSSEDLKPSTVESPVDIPAEAEPKAPVEVQEQRVYAESNDASESVPAVTEAPTVSARPDISATLASEAVVEEAPSVSPDNTQTATDDATSMEVEPSASQPGPVQPQPDVITADSVPASSTAALDVTHSDLPAVDATEEFVSEEPEPELEPEPEPPASHFKFIDLYDEEQEEVPPLSVQDAILLCQPNLQELELNVEAVLQENLKIVSQNKPIVSSDDDEVALEIFTMPHKVWRSLYRGTLLSASQGRDNWILSKASCLEYDYMNYHEEWMKHCARLDYLAEQRRVRGAQAAAAAAQNVVSEPVAAQTRSTRRNPVVNTGVMADAVHSDMEMEKVMNNMRDAAAVDPDLLARPNLAKIPDMVTISGPEMVRLTFNDENGQVDNPLDFYDFRGRAAEQWTTEERNIFIEQHRIYNKRFEKIAEHLPHKTTSQCVQYYYLMKKVPSFRAQVKRGQRRRLGRGGHQGKASALMADIEKEEDGTTASPREDESIATRRSRRHVATVAAAALAGTPPPSASTATEGTKPRRSRVAELARANSFGTDRDGTATPTSFASDSETGGDPLNPTDLDSLLSNQPLRKGGPGRGRRWAHKGEVPNGNGGSVRLDGAAPSKKRPATTSYWTVAERTTLKQNLLRHGRDWNRIAAVLQTKTAIQAKNYYSNNQKEMSVFVRAWEREQAKVGILLCIFTLALRVIQANGESASALASEIKPESSANASPAPASKDARKTSTPVTIQPAPGQNTTTPPTNGTASPGKSTSGRGSSHYPNVIPQSQTSQPAPQQPQWSRNTFSTTKPKSQGSANQPQAIPTPPLPLPGPTFRAWPVTATPPPPPMSFAFGTFSGVAGPSVPKGNGSTQVVAPSVQRTGSASASASATPSPVANSSPASNSNRTSGVQRTNLNHYPGPMRYQPYPIAATSPGSGNKSKPILLQRSSASTLVTVAPTPGTVPAQAAAASGAPGPKTQLPRNSSGQFAPWGGEKGKK